MHHKHDKNSEGWYLVNAEEVHFTIGLSIKEVGRAKDRHVRALYL